MPEKDHCVALSIQKYIFVNSSEILAMLVPKKSGGIVNKKITR